MKITSICVVLALSLSGTSVLAQDVLSDAKDAARSLGAVNALQESQMERQSMHPGLKWTGISLIAVGALYMAFAS